MRSRWMLVSCLFVLGIAPFSHGDLMPGKLGPMDKKVMPYDGRKIPEYGESRINPSMTQGGLAHDSIPLMDTVRSARLRRESMFGPGQDDFGTGLYGKGDYGTDYDGRGDQKRVLYRKGHHGKGHHGKGDHGKGHHGKGDHGKGHHGKGHHGKGHHGKGHDGKGHHGKGHHGKGHHGKGEH